jgi:SSS family solute:Na+ symporter
MFWKRATGHAAFAGLLTGTVAAGSTYCLTIAEGKGGYLGVVHSFPSSMAQNFWVAIMAFCTCFLVTIVVSLMTKAKPLAELEGLVYGVKPVYIEPSVWWKRPAVLAVIAAVCCIGLNLLFY